MLRLFARRDLLMCMPVVTFQNACDSLYHFCTVGIAFSTTITSPSLGMERSDGSHEQLMYDLSQAPMVTSLEGYMAVAV
jgi:hypothetical protein